MLFFITQFFLMPLYKELTVHSHSSPKTIPFANFTATKVSLAVSDSRLSM